MKKSWWANLYFLIILLIQLFLPISKLFKATNIMDVRLMLLISHTIIFLVPAIIYLLITRQSPFKVLKLKRLYFKDSLLLILVAFMCQPIMMFFSLIAQFFFENEIGNFITGIVSTPYPILILLIAVLPAITEEITIRGIVLSGYDNINIFVACGITGLLFGIMHLDPQQFLYATVLGFVLAYVVRITGSIFASVLVHFIINATSVTIQKAFSFVQSYIDTESNDINLRALPLFEKFTMIAIYGAIAVVFIFIVYRILRSIKEANVRRGIVSRETVEYRGVSKNIKDNPFNLPFIAVIIVYLVVMIKQII